MRSNGNETNHNDDNSSNSRRFEQGRIAGRSSCRLRVSGHPELLLCYYCYGSRNLLASAAHVSTYLRREGRVGQGRASPV